jgi:hypothetical protein
MMTYMGIIEQRINEIIQCYQTIQLKKKQIDDEENAITMGVGPTVGPSHGPLRIEPPSFGEEVSDEEMSEEGSEKPLGIEEFKQRVEFSKKTETKTRKKKGTTKK